jgi:hypothetical protein
MPPREAPAARRRGAKSPRCYPAPPRPRRSRRQGLFPGSALAGVIAGAVGGAGGSGGLRQAWLSPGQQQQGPGAEAAPAQEALPWQETGRRHLVRRAPGEGRPATPAPSDASGSESDSSEAGPSPSQTGSGASPAERRSGVAAVSEAVAAALSLGSGGGGNAAAAAAAGDGERWARLFAAPGGDGAPGGGPSHGAIHDSGLCGLLLDPKPGAAPAAGGAPGTRLPLADSALLLRLLLGAQRLGSRSLGMTVMPVRGQGGGAGAGQGGGLAVMGWLRRDGSARS